MSGTKPFPADNVKLHIASAADAPTGMIAEVDAWRAVGGFAMLNGHDFAATSSDAYTMAYSEHTPLIEYIASLRDAGSIDVMTWSQWFSTYCS